MGPRLSGLRPDQGFQSVRIAHMFPLPSARTCETILPAEAGIPGIRDTLVLVISKTGADTVCSFSPQCGLEGPVSVLRCGTGAVCYTDRPERLGYRRKLRTGLMGQDYRDLRACLHYHTTD